MLNRIIASGAVVIGLACAVPVLAQQRPDQLEGRAPTARPVFPEQQEQLLPRPQEGVQEPIPADQLALARADSIVGAAVHSRDGEQIGDVRAVVLDVPQGAIAYAVIGVGGFLGVAGREVAVPWDRLEPAGRPNAFILDVDRSTLEQAPPLQSDVISMTEQDRVTEQIARFWQEQER